MHCWSNIAQLNLACSFNLFVFLASTGPHRQELVCENISIKQAQTIECPLLSNGMSRAYWVLYFPILSCILHCYVIQPSIALPIYIICSFSVSCCAYRLFAVVLCFACQCNFLEHLVMLTCHCILSICQGHANGCNSLELELGACMKF